MSEKIYIFDTTLRDGEQSPGASLSTGDKIVIARQLQKLGVDYIEAGFPISSPGDFESVKLVAKEIKGVGVVGLTRALKKDIDRAYDALKLSDHPRIHTFLATSPVHRKYKLNMSKEQILTTATDAVRYAKKLVSDVEFSAEDAGRTEPEYLARVVEAVINAGATTVNIPDTVGYTISAEFSSLIDYLMNTVPNIGKAVISVHCHNDLGLATANSLAAVAAGARQIECTINGLGERAGNAALEEVVMALYVRNKYFNLTTDINTKELYKTSQLVSRLTGLYVQVNKAIVGANAFAHEAGIHQDGVMKESTTYEIMRADLIGLDKSRLVLGRHSGHHALAKRMKDLGYSVTDADLMKIFRKFKVLADKKKEIFDEDVHALVHDQIDKFEEKYKLVDISVFTGKKMNPTATVTLAKGKKEFTDAANGDGPIEAVYNAIERITGIKGKLIDYRIHSISSGKDAQGEVTVRVMIKDREVYGRGLSTDVIEASTRAYLNAMNKVIV